MARKTRIDGDKELLDDMGNYADVNPQTGTAYTLVKTDAGALITATNAGAITITVPADIFDVGDRIDIIQGGAGTVTVAAGAGTTLHKLAAKAATTSGQYTCITVSFKAANIFNLNGELA
jgi:hypothetical protein